VFDDGRAGCAEETFSHVEASGCVDVPDSLARGEVNGGELTLGAERVNTSTGDDRKSARALLQPQGVLIGRRVRVAPLGISGAAVERFDDFLFVHAVKQDQPVARYHWPGESFAHRLLPDLSGSIGRPLGSEWWAAVLAVSVGTKILRP